MSIEKVDIDNNNEVPDTQSAENAIKEVEGTTKNDFNITLYSHYSYGVKERKVLEKIPKEKLSNILNDIMLNNNINNCLDFFCQYKSGQKCDYKVPNPFRSLVHFKNVALRLSGKPLTCFELFKLCDKLNPKRLKEEILSAFNSSGIIYIQDFINVIDNNFDTICYNDSKGNNITVNKICQTILLTRKKHIDKAGILKIIDYLDLTLDPDKHDDENDLDEMLNKLYGDKKVKFNRKNYSEAELYNLATKILEKNKIETIFDIIDEINSQSSEKNFTPFCNIKGLISSFLGLPGINCNLKTIMLFCKDIGFDHIEIEFSYLLRTELGITKFCHLCDYGIEKMMSHTFTVGYTGKYITDILFSKYVVKSLEEPIFKQLNCELNK